MQLGYQGVDFHGYLVRAAADELAFHHASIWVEPSDSEAESFRRIPFLSILGKTVALLYFFQETLYEGFILGCRMKYSFRMHIETFPIDVSIEFLPFDMTILVYPSGISPNALPTWTFVLGACTSCSLVSQY